MYDEVYDEVVVKNAVDRAHEEVARATTHLDEHGVLLVRKGKDFIPRLQNTCTRTLGVGDVEQLHLGLHERLG